MVVGVDRGVSAFEVAAPFAESFHECVEFLFPSGISGDGMWMLTRKEADGVRIVGGRGTSKENSTHSKVGRVRVYLKRKRKIGKSEAWSGGDECLEVVESRSAGLVPIFTNVVILVSCEVREGSCMRGEMVNEATVIAGET